MRKLNTLIIIILTIFLSNCASSRKVKCDAYGHMENKEATFPKNFDEAEYWLDQKHSR